MAELAGATVAFDLDGTLVDTAPDLVRALNLILGEEGLPPALLAEARLFVGQGARKLIERAGAAAGRPFEDAALDRLTERFIAHYRKDIARESAPFPGCLEALHALKEKGARLSVCTNKRTDLSIQVLEALDMVALFDAIVGADAAPQRKPHPSHLLTAIARAGGDPSRCVMVGDTTADIAAARDASVASVLVSFGYCDAALDSLGADRTVNTYAEAQEAVIDLLRPKHSSN